MVRLLIVFSFICSFLSADIVLGDDKKLFDDFNIEYLHDPAGLLTIEDVSKITFTKKTSNNFTFGYRDDAVWFKLKIKNDSSKKDYILHFSEAIWQNFDLYEYKNSKWQVRKNGLDVPLENRDIKDVHPAFMISVPTDSSAVFYIRGKSIASQIGQFWIFSLDEYYSPSKFTVPDIYMIFAFSAFTIFLLNLYSYYLTREKVYIYYISYVFAFILFSAMHSGFYLLFGFPGWNQGLHFIGALVILSLLLFSKRFLELEKNIPKVNIFFNISAFVFASFSILILLDIQNIAVGFNIYSTVFFFVLFYAAVKVLLQGNVSAKYYLMALILYTPLMSLMILTFNSLLEYTMFNRHSFLLGAFIEILFFTLILSSKYRVLNLQKLKLQEEILQSRESREKELQKQISQKTKDIREIINKFEFATDNALAGYWEINLESRTSITI